jgi:hypothetical protein
VPNAVIAAAKAAAGSAVSAAAKAAAGSARDSRLQRTGPQPENTPKPPDFFTFGAKHFHFVPNIKDLRQSATGSQGEIPQRELCTAGEGAQTNLSWGLQAGWGLICNGNSHAQRLGTPRADGSTPAHVSWDPTQEKKT